LVGMQIKFLTQLRHCFVLAQRGKCHLRFECVGVLPAYTFANAGLLLQLDQCGQGVITRVSTYLAVQIRRTASRYC